MVNGVQGSQALGRVRRLGFMAGQIAVPDDFDRMGAADTAALFGGDTR